MEEGPGRSVGGQEDLESPVQQEAVRVDVGADPASRRVGRFEEADGVAGGRAVEGGGEARDAWRETERERERGVCVGLRGP
jgi:hypothetical protein